MHVVIIGEGIAGPVLGVALRRAGIDATIYEAGDERGLGGGAFLQLAPNGVNALGAIGLVGLAERAGGFPTSGIRFASARGRTIGELDSRGEQQRYGAANVLVKRADLHVALREAAADHYVPVVLGKQLAEYRTTATGIEAVFADGSTVAGDVLIGCDGIGSRTRRLLLSPGPALSYTGMMNLGGFARVNLEDRARNHMVFGRSAFFGYTPAPSGEVYWFSNVPQRAEPTARGDGRTAEEWLRRLRLLHADDPEPIPQILAATAPPVGAWPIHDLPTLPRWHDERVCLVGDAAHAMSPSAGQGASIAIEDAVVLAKCLRDLPDAATAFASYQRLRKDRAEAVVKQARRNSNHKFPGPIGGAIRDLLLPQFLKFGVKQAAETYAYTIDFNERLSPTVTSRA